MDGWRGLIVLSIGLAIGAGLWFGVVSLVEPPSGQPQFTQAAPPSRLALAITGQTRVASAAKGEGITGATVATAPANADEEEAPPQPFKIIVGASEVQTLLESSPFVHRITSGPVLYVVTFRTCPACADFKEHEWAALDAAGVDTRWIVYARRDHEGEARSTDPERAMIAELALSRSYTLFESWFKAPSADQFYQTAQLPASADASPSRIAAVEGMRQLIDNLNAVTTANGEELAIPAFFWKQTDGWRGMVGYDEKSFAAVKAALTQTTAGMVAPNNGH
ncbi:MAG: hypothetical protein WAW96_10530 [Alphaproteobacteria bacterium]